MQLRGIHHLTAITGNVSTNHAFYTRTLGLRLVKKTVNQDDVSAYHLFYADGRATPGTDITFFDWPLPRERRGTHSIVRTGLRVAAADTLRYWLDRFNELGVTHGEIADLDGRATLDFEDGEGQRLRLVAGDDRTEAHPWEQSPVPAEHQIRGLGPITISVPDVGKTDMVLTRVMNMRYARDYTAPPSNGAGGAANTIHVYEMGDGGPAAALHVAVEPNLPPASQGAGAVHHVAFRVPTFEEYDRWNARLHELRIPSIGSTSAASTSASPTASSSSSPPTAPGSTPTNPWKRSARSSRSRRSSSRSARKSKRGLNRSSDDSNDLP